MENLRWHKNEINMLKVIYEDLDINIINKIFAHRSKMSIMIKANRLGLKKNKMNKLLEYSNSQRRSPLKNKG